MLEHFCSQLPLSTFYSCAAVGSSWVNRRWRLARSCVRRSSLSCWIFGVCTFPSGFRYVSCLFTFGVGSKWLWLKRVSSRSSSPGRARHCPLDLWRVTRARSIGCCLWFSPFLFALGSSCTVAQVWKLLPFICFGVPAFGFSVVLCFACSWV